MIHFWSDPHIMHDNVITYCDRPFSSVDEMNEALIENYNKKVSKKDVVFCLGDLAFKTSYKREEIKVILSRLNTIPILIRGNHDKLKHMLDLGLTQVYNEAYLHLSDKIVWLNHFPINLHDKREGLIRPSARMKWDLALFGHTHCKKEDREVYDNWNKLIGLNVGVDAWDYSPVSWDEIMEIYF